MPKNTPDSWQDQSVVDRTPRPNELTRRDFIKNLLAGGAAASAAACAPSLPPSPSQFPTPTIQPSPIDYVPLLRAEICRGKRELVRKMGLEESYMKALEAQASYQLLKRGERLPTFCEVMEVFSLDELDMAENFEDPTLILSTKGRSFSDLISAMDAHKKMLNQGNADADMLYDKFFETKRLSWGAYIVDGARVMPVLREFDDEKLTLIERSLRWQERSLRSLKSMTADTVIVNLLDRWKYAQLMMQSLNAGRPIDFNNTVTILDGDPNSENSCPGAAWNPNTDQVYFRTADYGLTAPNGRFRRCVGGDVPNV